MRHERHRAIVVGAGLGGSITAYRLAEAGVETLVLERGREWPITPRRDTFPSFWKPDSRAAWFSRKAQLPIAPSCGIRPYPGLLERIQGKGIDVVVGAGVGGSTLVYGAIMGRPPRDLFTQVMPAAVDFDEMDRVYYPRFRAAIGFDPIPDDVLAHPRYLAARVFVDHATRAGLEPSRLLCGVDWNVVRDELAGREPKCLSIGEYVYGASNGAKRSVDRNYLARARATGFAEVRPLHLVDRVSEACDGGFEVHARRIDETGATIERLCLRCEALILAGGSMGTSRLLVEARETGRLPRLSSHVGRHWGNNGERVFMRLGLGERTGGHQGGPPSAGTMFQRTPLGPISLEAAAAPLPFEIRAMMVVGIGIPRADGYFRYDRRSGRAVLHWPRSAAAEARNASLELIDRIDSATSGGLLLDFDALFGSPSYHPLGGAVLERACDAYGRVRGYAGLIVADASLIPGSTGCVNPAWTLGALVERDLDRVLEDGITATAP